MRKFPVLLLLLVATVAAAGSAPTPGASAFSFTGWAGPALPVRLYLPEGLAADTPVVIVMHGASRDADRYFHDWREVADEYNLIVVVPAFSAADFPKSAAYNLGNRVAADGQAIPQERWSFAAIEPLFDEVVARIGGAQTGYSLYGHSAGSQFVHRFLYYMPQARVHRAIAANAGWYTVPEFGIEYPYGLEHAGVSEEQLKVALARRLVLLLGDADIDTNASKLRKTPEAELQGANRFMRGHTMFRVASAKARELETDFNWSLQVVPGAGHVNAQMTPAAAKLFE